MALKLYVASNSPPCLAVMHFIKHTDLDVELSEMDLMKGEHKTDEFAKKNPLQQVPTLSEGDDFHVGESNTILRYLADSQNQSDYYPEDPQIRGRIDELLDWNLTDFYKGTYDYFNNTKIRVKQGKEAPAEHLVTGWEEGAEKNMGILNTIITDNGGEFMTGGQVTLCDFQVYQTVCFVEHLFEKVKVNDHDKVKAWKASMEE